VTVFGDWRSGIKDRLALTVACFVLALAANVSAQRGRGGPPQPPQPAKAAAPIDLTGYWVSIVSEDWRWRMVTPSKGDYNSVPINAEAKKVADAWDPAKDEAAGEQCKSYGAPALMRVPGRLHITWQDDNTLKVETDAGMQTRLLHFGDWKSPGGEPSWQGDSVATWETPPRRGSFGVGVNEEGVASNQPKFGSLKVVTTRMKPGYLRKNGIPYSENAALTEFWDLLKRPNGEQWIVITTTVEDPKYLQLPWITSLNFRKEPNGTKWDPSPCSSRW
jgi:hypothetical protein